MPHFDRNKADEIFRQRSKQDYIPHLDRNKADDIFNKWSKQDYILSKTHKGSDRITQDDLRNIQEQEKIEAEKRESQRRELLFRGIAYAIPAIPTIIVFIYLVQQIFNPTRRGEICTYYTNTYPRKGLEVHAVGHGQEQKLRRDTFATGASGMQPIEHTIVNSGMTYSWKEGNLQGYKFPNAPLPFRQYFDLQKYPLRCYASEIKVAVFNPPENINFIEANKDTFSKKPPAQTQTPRTCAAFDVESDRWIRANVYFGSVKDKMRLDVERKNLRNDSSENRHVISNARVVYMWNDKSNKGIMFNIKGEEAPKEMLVPQLQKNCHTWKQETSAIFEPPANITFKLANKDEVLSYVTEFNRF